MTALREATSNGAIIVSCTQCSHGAVSGIYETGKALIDAGVIPGGWGYLLSSIKYSIYSISII